MGSMPDIVASNLLGLPARSDDNRDGITRWCFLTGRRQLPISLPACRPALPGAPLHHSRVGRNPLPPPLDSGLRRKDGRETAVFIPSRGLRKAIGNSEPRTCRSVPPKCHFGAPHMSFGAPQIVVRCPPKCHSEPQARNLRHPPTSMPPGHEPSNWPAWIDSSLRFAPFGIAMALRRPRMGMKMAVPPTRRSGAGRNPGVGRPGLPLSRG